MSFVALPVRSLGLLTLLCTLCAVVPQEARAQVGPVSCPPLVPSWKNIASEAQITVSSVLVGGSGAPPGGCMAVDGVIGVQFTNEWTSNAEQNPWIKLEWPTARTIDSVDLYDRAHPGQNYNAGVLSFSDGSTISVSGIPADGALKSVTFAPKTVTWVKFQGTGGTGGYSGLSEIAVGEVHPAASRPYARSSEVNLVFWPGARLSTSMAGSAGANQLDTKFGYDENNGKAFPDASWLQLDLGVGHVQQVDRVRLRFTPPWNAAGYKVWVGNDPTNATNTLVAQVTNHTGTIATPTFPATSGRFVRVQLFASQPTGTVAVDGLSVYSTDAKQVNRYYPVSEEGSGGAKLEPLKGWGWYHSTRKPSNLISGHPATISVSTPDEREDSVTALDLAYEGASARIQLDDTYALEKLRLGYKLNYKTPTALKVQLSVDDIHYHTVFDGSLPPGYAPTLTWSTANGHGDARYVRITLPKTAAPHSEKEITRLELYGLPVASPTIVAADPQPPGTVNIGDFDVLQEGYLSAAIYTTSGRLVRTLKNREPIAAGNARPLYWDGKDDLGATLPGGDYTWKAVVSRVAPWDDGSVGDTGTPSHGLTNAPYLALPLAYDSAGHLYAGSSFDEAEMELRRYRPDGTADWAVKSLYTTAVASDGQYVYVAKWDTSGQPGNVLERRLASNGAVQGFTAPTGGLISINPPASDPKPSNQRRATTDQERWLVGVNGVAVDTSHLWVSNYRQNRVERYDKSSGTFLSSFAVTKPSGIAVDASGNVWVAHGGSQVTKYGASGTALQTLSNLGDPYVVTLGVGGSRLFVTEHGTGRVLEYATSGTLVSARGGKATPGPLQADRFRWGPRSGLAVDDQGQYVVADIGNHRLQWFHANGTLRQTMSSEFVSHPFVDETNTTPNLVLSGPRQYTVDHATGAWQYTHNWTPTDNAFVDEASKRRRLRVQTPQGPIDRDYLFFTKDGLRGGVVVYLLEPGDTGMRRAAAIGSGWTGADDNTVPGSGYFEWTDTSADGVVDLAEVAFPTQQDGGFAGNFFVWVSDTGDLWFAGTSPQQGAVVIPLGGFDANLNPIYSFANKYTVLPVDTSPTNYRESVIRSIPGSTSFLTLGSTAQSDAVRGTGGFGSGFVATLHDATGAEQIRVNLHEERKAFTIAADGEYWYTANSRGDQHWVNMYDELGLLIATMRPGAPSNWGAGWMDHPASMTARKSSKLGPHYVYAEDVFWGRMIRYGVRVNSSDLSRSSGFFSWSAPQESLR